MRQQQFDGLRLGRIGGIVDEPPEAGLAQCGRFVVSGVGQSPGPRLPVQVVATVVRNHDLLAEPIVAAWSAALDLAAPHTHQRQQCEQRVVEVRALTQVGSVDGQRQVVEHRDVAGRRCFRSFGRSRDCVVAGGHDSSVMRRYNAYSANHVMTTTAATSMISKNSTTAASLAAGAPTTLGDRRRTNYRAFDAYFGGARSNHIVDRNSSLRHVLAAKTQPRPVTGRNGSVRRP